jgi:hypothetical protein
VAAALLDRPDADASHETRAVAADRRLSSTWTTSPSASGVSSRWACRESQPRPAEIGPAGRDRRRARRSCDGDPRPRAAIAPAARAGDTLHRLVGDPRRAQRPISAPDSMRRNSQISGPISTNSTSALPSVARTRQRHAVEPDPHGSGHGRRSVPPAREKDLPSRGTAARRRSSSVGGKARHRAPGSGRTAPSTGTTTQRQRFSVP